MICNLEKQLISNIGVSGFCFWLKPSTWSRIAQCSSAPRNRKQEIKCLINIKTCNMNDSPEFQSQKESKHSRATVKGICHSVRGSFQGHGTRNLSLAKWISSDSIYQKKRNEAGRTVLEHSDRCLRMCRNSADTLPVYAIRPTVHWVKRSSSGIRPSRLDSINLPQSKLQK